VNMKYERLKMRRQACRLKEKNKQTYTRTITLTKLLYTVHNNDAIKGQTCIPNKYLHCRQTNILKTNALQRPRCKPNTITLRGTITL